MKTLVSILFIVLLVSSKTVFAQTSDSLIQFEKTIGQTAKDLYADGLGNLYLINDQNQVKKLNAKGDSIAVFNFSKRLGAPTFIDATYPLKTILFYKPYSTFIVVDRLLNLTNNIDLRKEGLFQVNAVTASYDNQFWIYDDQVAQLKKIDNQGRILQATIDLRPVLKELPSPIQVIDNDNLVYLYDSARGVYSFDYYGAYKSFIPFTGFDRVNIYNKVLYGVKGNMLYKMKEDDKAPITFSLPVLSDVEKVFIEKNKIYFLRKNGIDIYNTNF